MQLTAVILPFHDIWPVTCSTTFPGTCFSLNIKSSSAFSATTNDPSTRTSNHSKTIGFQSMISLCPRAAEYFSDQAKPAMFRVSVSDCRHPGYDPRSRYGVVCGVCNGSTSFCQFHVQVSRYKIVSAVKSLSRSTQEQLLSTSHQMLVTQYTSPTYHIQFEAMTFNNTLRISDVGGSITMPAPSKRRHIRDSLAAPRWHVIMVTFDIFRPRQGCFKSIHLLWREHSKDDTEQEHIITQDDNKSVYIFNSKVLHIHVYPPRRLPYSFQQLCMKMLFSFHPVNSVPQRQETDLYNCSVDDYWRFQQHLDCNLKVECEDGRDETEHCPYSSPECKHWVASRHKCYKLFFPKMASPAEALNECKKHNSEVASIKTEQELADVLKIFQGRALSETMIALQIGQSILPFMYRYFYSWLDKTLVYNMHQLKLLDTGLHDASKKIVYHFWHDNMELLQIYEHGFKVPRVACEKKLRRAERLAGQPVLFPAILNASEITKKAKQALARCPEGHVTHTFLTCDPKSRCGQATCQFLSESADKTGIMEAKQNRGDIMAMYSCSTYNVMVHYTLVCDFRWDCPDGSDESFCRHPSCDAFKCSNGQCILSDKRCNGKIDCLDNTDETICSFTHLPVTRMTRQHGQQRFLIELDGNGYFTYRSMNNSEICPETHYLCRLEWMYCLPIYTRCNGYSDCIYGEDERDCESITCPGLYLCRDSTVCLHADHLCDGWPQCPQHDDEWLCDATCPKQCLCQGYFFRCPQPFSPRLIPQIRFLDASGSEMTFSDLNNNTYLVSLNLAHCFISFLPDMKFPNIKYLDLSYNQLTSIVMNVFLTQENLQSLSLRGNPLASIINVASHLKQYALQRLDLSRTCLGVFDSQVVRQFLALQYMNVSNSSLRSVEPAGFQGAPNLIELDVRGNEIATFPADLFYGLDKLAFVLSSNYRLCCKDLLPPSTKCLTPNHFLSSCEHMIQSSFYRFALWFVTIVASFGNLTCIITYRALKRLQYGNNVTAFMMSLQCANFCMGSYTGVIAAADERFRGRFHHHEYKWKDSVACKTAGFLSSMASEVSVFTVFLLALDKVIVLCFPHSKFSFSWRSAAVACGVVWVVGSVLACIPLLPAVSYRGNHDQTALCNLMVQNGSHLNRGFPFFRAATALNCSICFIVSIAQIFVVRAMPKHWLLINPHKNPACVSVKLILKLAATTTIAWFSITTVSVLALAGVVDSQKATVATAVLVLPLSSAVYPLFSLWHVVACLKQKKQEERLLCVLKSRSKPLRNTGYT